MTKLTVAIKKGHGSHSQRRHILLTERTQSVPRAQTCDSPRVLSTPNKLFRVESTLQQDSSNVDINER